MPSKQAKLTVIDYSYDEMVIGVSIFNQTAEKFLFSEKNITVQHLCAQKYFNAKAYNYNELLSEYSANSDYSKMVQAGTTTASIGSSFIPFGGIAMSLGRFFTHCLKQKSHMMTELML